MLLWSGLVALGAWACPSSSSLNVYFSPVFWTLWLLCLLPCLWSTSTCNSLRKDTQEINCLRCVFLKTILFHLHSWLTVGLDMEMWVGNQFPLKLWRHCSIVSMLLSSRLGPLFSWSSNMPIIVPQDTELVHHHENLPHVTSLKSNPSTPAPPHLHYHP